ncbi:MAG: DUF1836 domain-containing protein [Clostridia bacterium]|nr:DUF1836 domain-containing protein [Clostridia bacterium]
MTMTDAKIKIRLQASVANFHLPRYHELPNVGLYLEQVTQYINSFLGSVSCAEITTSMISNYVKKGFIPSPQKKQYDADRIAYLIFIAITKNVLPLENIVALFEMQKTSYSIPMAYNYFCCELENMLSYVFGLKDKPEKNLGVTTSDEKDLLRNVIISVSHSLYLSAYFSEIKRMSPEDLRL